MTHDELLLFARQTFDDCLEILDRKGKDYSKPDDCFSAMRLAENFGVCCVETTILSQLCSRFSRLVNVVVAGKTPENEEDDEAINDIINYLVFLKKVRKGPTL